MSDELKWAIGELQRYVMAPAGAGFGLSKSAAYRLLNELSTRARRAALVAEWAEGLRAGKRYATTTEDGVKWEAGVNRFLDGERFYVSAPLSYPSYCWVMSTHLAAQFMLVISDQWAEAG